MGSWGIALSSSDTYSDIYSSFIDLYNEGEPIEKIMERITSDYSSVINDEDERNDFYFAIIKAQWECGLLQDKYRIELEKIVDNNLEIKRWERLGGSTKEAQRRHEEVKELLEKVSSPNSNIKIPKPKKLRNSYFRKGDCIALKDNDDRYSAAVVLSEEEKTEWGLNLILVLKYYDSIKPAISFFQNAECLLSKDVKGEYKPFLIYCYAKDVKKHGDSIELIGKLNITVEYKPKYGTSYGLWSHISEYSKRLANANIQEKPVKAKSFYKRHIWKK
jgi:hypothetical protein